MWQECSFERVKDVYAGRHASLHAVTDSSARLNDTSSPIGREALVDEFKLKGEDEAKYTFYIAEEGVH